MSHIKCPECSGSGRSPYADVKCSWCLGEGQISPDTATRYAKMLAHQVSRDITNGDSDRQSAAAVLTTAADIDAKGRRAAFKLVE